jgi:A/G-specific adenine glycosylase
MKNRSLLQKKLLTWYRESHRPLPWRSTRDPYAIWISEILLQQTRVNTGLSYYERFMERFPTLSDLAEAPIEEILRVWQGLGYYGRARNLHRSARILKEEFQGEIPPEPEVLERLPGIGPYTAAAIASIAFDKDVAVLDGNVTRVLCRAYGIEDDPKHPSTRRTLKGLANRLLPKGNAAIFNQALMELGALVCKPARPECGACPLKGNCVAHAKNITRRLPFRSPRARVPIRVRVVAAIEVRGRLLFKRRDLEGLLGGLWELPGVYLEAREGNREAFKRIRKQVGSLVTLPRIPERSHFSVRHVYSHFEESIRVFVCKGKGVSKERRKPGAEQTYRWIHPNRLDPYPLTGATLKILQGLEKRKAEQRG